MLAAKMIVNISAVVLMTLILNLFSIRPHEWLIPFCGTEYLVYHKSILCREDRQESKVACYC